MCNKTWHFIPNVIYAQDSWKTWKLTLQLWSDETKFGGRKRVITIFGLGLASSRLVQVCCLGLASPPVSSASPWPHLRERLYCLAFFSKKKCLEYITVTPMWYKLKCAWRNMCTPNQNRWIFTHSQVWSLHGRLQYEMKIIRRNIIVGQIWQILHCNN